MIALAFVGDPQLLLADAPTSNLDATVQQRVLDLLDDLSSRRSLSLLLVTDDVAVAAERASHIVVMRQGRIVEQGSADAIIEAPRGRVYAPADRRPAESRAAPPDRASATSPVFL